MLTVGTAQSACFRLLTSYISDILEQGLFCSCCYSHLVSLNKCTKIGYVFNDRIFVQKNIYMTEWNRMHFKQGGRFQ